MSAAAEGGEPQPDADGDLFDDGAEQQQQQQQDDGVASPPTGGGPLPYGYYDSVLTSPTATVIPLDNDDDPIVDTFPGGRKLYRIIDPAEGIPHPGIVLAHIPTFLRWTDLDQASGWLDDVSDSGYDGAAGTILGMHHFNNGIGTIAPALSDIHKKCSVRFNTEHVDTINYELVATVQTLGRINPTLSERRGYGQIYGDGFGTRPQMAALLGSTTSSNTATIAGNAGAFRLPQISPSATSALLDNPYEFGMLSRTIPSDGYTAMRLAGYLKEQLKVTHLGLLYVSDAYGNSFHESMRIACSKENIQMVSASIPVQISPVTTLPGDKPQSEIEAALVHLSATKFNYIVGVFYPSAYELIMERAYDMGLAGQGKLWIFTSALDPLFVNSKSANSDDKGEIRIKTGSAVANASAGNLIFSDEGGLEGFPHYDNFLREWRRIGNGDDDEDGGGGGGGGREALDYINSKVPLQYLHQIIMISTDAGQNEAFNFSRSEEYFTDRYPSYVASFAYDAVVGLGLSACEEQRLVGMDANTTFSGETHLSRFVNDTFEGASGRLAFGADGTKSRDADTTYFVVSNIREIHNTGDEDEEGEGGTTSTFTSVPVQYYNSTSGKWMVYQNNSFVYPGNETLPPPAIPPADVKHFNSGARGFVLGLAALGMLLAVVFLIFTVTKRKQAIIRASQPPFLILVCAGCLLMFATIIPMSMDDSVASEHGCAVACMAKFWLASVGFCLAFSALFSKLWRINRVMKNAKGFKKVAVTPMDVIVPLLVLVGANLVILIVWTAVFPFRWEYRPVSTDEFGRVTEEVGHCVSDHQMAFVATLIALDGIAIIITLWQAYVARNVSTDFSESKYVGYAVVSIFEVTFIGVPAIFIVSDSPTAVLFMSSAIVFISAASVLLFIYVPKIWAMKKGEQGMASSSGAGAKAYRNDAGEVLNLRKENEQLRQELKELRAKLEPEATNGATMATTGTSIVGTWGDKGNDE